MPPHGDWRFPLLLPTFLGKIGIESMLTQRNGSRP